MSVDNLRRGLIPFVVGGFSSDAKFRRFCHTRIIELSAAFFLCESAAACNFGCIICGARSYATRSTRIIGLLWIVWRKVWYRCWIDLTVDRINAYMLYVRVSEYMHQLLRWRDLYTCIAYGLFIRVMRIVIKIKFIFTS